VTKYDEAAVVAAYRDGTRVGDICDEQGVPRSIVYRILRRNGVEPDRMRRLPVPEVLPHSLTAEQREQVLIATTLTQQEEIGRLRTLLGMYRNAAMAYLGGVRGPTETELFTGMIRQLNELIDRSEYDPPTG
jgi:hypothetical protein